MLMENHDESGIPSDLRGSIYAQSVKYGGEKEYLKVRSSHYCPSERRH